MLDKTKKLTLTMMLPRLPAEDKSWIKGLATDEVSCLEYILNLVGPDSFVANWQEHRETTEYMRHF